MTMDELFRPHNLELVLNMAAFVLVVITLIIH